MPRDPASLSQQRKLLRSLGFEFLEEAFEAPAAPAEARPAPRTAASPSPRRPPPAPKAAPGLSSLPRLPLEERLRELGQLNSQIAACVKCGRHLARKSPIAGGGSAVAELFVVVEMPAPEEDAAGALGAGEHGELVKKMISAMGYKEDEVFVSPAVKCHSLRAPVGEEVAACGPYLLRQIEIVQPRAILVFGAEALRALIPDRAREFNRLRGQFLDYRGVPLMPTFAPSYIARARERKRIVWEDLKLVMAKLGR